MSITEQYIQAIRTAYPVPSPALVAYLNGCFAENLGARQACWEALTDAEREAIREIAEQVTQNDAAA